MNSIDNQANHNDYSKEISLFTNQYECITVNLIHIFPGFFTEINVLQYRPHFQGAAGCINCQICRWYG